MRDDNSIIDAEFETIGPNRNVPAPSASSPASPERQETGDAVQGGLGLFEGSAAARDGQPMPRPIFAALAIVCPLAAFFMAGGHVLLPRGAVISHEQTASVPVRAVVLENVSTRVDSSGTRPVLVVRGSLANESAKAVPVPPVRIHAGGGYGPDELVHTITGRGELQPGERLAFTSRLPAGENGALEPRIEIGHP